MSESTTDIILQYVPPCNKTSVADLLKSMSDQIDHLERWKNKAEMKLIELGGELARKTSLEWIEVDHDTLATESGFWATETDVGQIARRMVGFHIFERERFSQYDALIIRAALIRSPK